MIMSIVFGFISVGITFGWRGVVGMLIGMFLIKFIELI